MVRLLSIATSIARTSRGAGLRRQRRQHRGAAAREQGVKPVVVIAVPRETAVVSVGVVRPQLKLDRFPDEFLCLTPAILLSYPTEWLRDGSGPSPLNRWEIRKANESQMQSMVSDMCISGLWSHAAGGVSWMPEVQPFHQPETPQLSERARTS